MMRLQPPALLLALPLLLGGCAALAPEAPPPVTVAQRTYHPAIEMGGRLSVRYETRTGEQALHGSFHWVQTPTDTQVTLLSPLGQAVARIIVTPAGATLLQPGQPPRTADDVDALTAQALGWPLPVAGLRNWLQGFTIDAQGERFIATPQVDTVVTNDGWLVQYPNWEREETGAVRPRRIDLVRQTPQAGEVAIRLVLDTWQTP